jgi:uncharacterized membrane protein
MSDGEPRRWSFWFIASLCLNLFLIGLIVVGLIVARKRMIAAEVSGGGGLAPEVVLSMLPQSGQVKMCTVLAGRADAYRRIGAEIVDARRDMYRTFRAEPFDSAAFTAAQNRLTEAQVALIRERAASSAAVTAQLDAAERKHFGDEIARRLAAPDRAGAQRRTLGALNDACAKVGVTLPK